MHVSGYISVQGADSSHSASRGVLASLMEPTKGEPWMLVFP